MRGIQVKKSTSKVELFRISKPADKMTYSESPFKSIIADIRSNLSKKEHNLIKNGLKYAEEMKELTKLQVKSFKGNLIKFKNDLIEKNKFNSRIKKDFNNYYGRNKSSMPTISHIYLMKKKMNLHMKILSICLMKKMSFYTNLHLNQ